MALSRAALHNPVVRPPSGPRTRDHLPHSLLPLVSSRNAHIARLYDLLHHLLSLAPSPATHVRAVRAWRALAQCREVHVRVLWSMGAAVIDRTRLRGSADAAGSRGGGGGAEADEDDPDGDEARWRAGQRAAWLHFNQEGPHDRVQKFNEYILALVAAGRAEFALDELESYLDNQPYHDSIALNTLYGTLSLLLAQPGSGSSHPAPSSSSSSSESTSSDDEDGGRRRGHHGPRAAKRAKRSVDAAPTRPGDEYGDLLRSIPLHSPASLHKARERLLRAVHLETQQQRETGHDPGPGEAARWLALIQRHTEKAARDDSPL